MYQSKQNLVDNLKFLIPGIVYSSSAKKPFDIISLDGNIEQITGYSEQDFISDSVSLLKIVHPDDIEKFSSSKNNIATSHGAFHFEYRVVKRDGKVIWVSESGYINDNQEIFGFINHQFIEGHRHQQLVDAQRLVLEVASSNEVASGQTIKVAKMICQACTKWLGVERTSVWLLDSSQNELDLVSLYLRSQDQFIDGITLSRSQYPNYFTALTSGRAIDAVNATTDPRTSEFAIGYLDELNIHSMLDAAVRNGDSIIGVICCEQTIETKNWSLDDINFAAELADQFSQTISNRERIKAREQALKSEASNLAKSSFIATISHEIRTPLNGMLGMAELLNDTLLSDQQKDIVETIQSSGELLLSVINDVLDYSKIEAGKLKIVAKPIDLKKLVEESWSIFRKKALEKNLQIRISANQSIPQVMLDGVRLKQVLSNLISNAVKFSSNGHILIRLELKPQSLLLSIQDFGKGISQELLSRLFTPFEQESGENEGGESRESRGTGLGLAISKKIVEAMNGALTVNSEIGKGSTFVVQLPLEIAQKPLNRKRLNSLRRPAENFQELVVWVAEDNIVNQRVICGMLKRHVIVAKVFENGQLLIDALIEHEVLPDLILMDCEMPVMDGISAAKLIKLTPAWKNIQIAALTAHALLEFKEKTREAGMEYFLSKPILTEELSSVLVTVMNEKLESR